MCACLCRNLVALFDEHFPVTHERLAVWCCPVKSKDEFTWQNGHFGWVLLVQELFELLRMRVSCQQRNGLPLGCWDGFVCRPGLQGVFCFVMGGLTSWIGEYGMEHDEAGVQLLVVDNGLCVCV